MANSSEIDAMCAKLSEDVTTGYLDHLAIDSVISRAKSCGKQKLSAETWRAFEDIFDDDLDIAVDIVQQEDVVYFYLEMDPEIGIFEVTTDAQVFHLLPSLNFCICSYYEEEEDAEECLGCPHVVACIVAKLNGSLRQIPVSNDHYEKLLTSVHDPGQGYHVPDLDTGFNSPPQSTSSPNAVGPSSEATSAYGTHSGVTLTE